MHLPTHKIDSRTQTIMVRQGPSQAVWWAIAVSLIVIATCLVVRLDDRLSPTAFAQTVNAAGARGVYSFTGQVSKNTYGVFMVDVDTGTIWCYEFVGAGGNRRLKLLAARTWRYDRYLERYNLEEPTPDEVERLVEIERTARLQASGSPQAARD